MAATATPNRGHGSRHNGAPTNTHTDPANAANINGPTSHRSTRPPVRNRNQRGDPTNRHRQPCTLTGHNSGTADFVNPSPAICANTPNPAGTPSHHQPPTGPNWPVNAAATPPTIAAPNVPRLRAGTTPRTANATARNTTTSAAGFPNRAPHNATNAPVANAPTAVCVKPRCATVFGSAQHRHVRSCTQSATHDTARAVPRVNKPNERDTVDPG